MYDLFAQFLTEATTDNSDYIAKQIAKECKMYLAVPEVKTKLKQIAEKLTLNSKARIIKQSSTGELLFRGFSPRLNDPQQIQVQAGRRPRDTTLAIHEALDAYFESTFGIKFRSNSYFTSSNHHQAYLYSSTSNPCLVFPIDGSTYLWSDSIHDATSYLDPFSYASESGSDFISSLPDSLGDKPTAKNKKIASEKLLAWLEENKPYHSGKNSTAITKAIKSGNEVMIHSDHYFAINQATEEGIAVLIKLGELLK